MKFTRGANLGRDFCAGTCLTVNGCLLLDHSEKFVERDLYSEFLNPAKLDLLSAIALKVLKPIPNFTDTEEVRAAARASTEKVAVFLALTEQLRRLCHSG